jgi:hypothetical protein
MRIVITAVSLAFAISCASSKPKENEMVAPPQPPESVGGGDLAKGSGAVTEEVKQAVSEQLGGCPIDKITIICTEKDRSGECIAVRGLGCDKEIEYKFGTD